MTEATLAHIVAVEPIMRRQQQHLAYLLYQPITPTTLICANTNRPLPPGYDPMKEEPMFQCSVCNTRFNQAVQTVQHLTGKAHATMLMKKVFLTFLFTWLVNLCFAFLIFKIQFKN